LTLNPARSHVRATTVGPVRAALVTNRRLTSRKGDVMSPTPINDQAGHHGKTGAPTGPRTRFVGPAGRDRLPV